jgi:hypothetical protein
MHGKDISMIFITKNFNLIIQKWFGLRERPFNLKGVGYGFFSKKIFHNTEKCTAKNSKFVVIFMYSFMSV